ncbi:MAG: universal stress protein [Proteobacteria bacterium]|nr:universal stress protein [Pseudomonadota bacterium]
MDDRQPVRSVIVGTDFSETASLALNRGVELALQHRAPLRLIHAVHLQPFLDGGPPLTALPPDFEGRLRAAAVDQLEQWRRDAEAEGVRAEAEVVTGAPASALVDAVAKAPDGVLVIGTRGQTGFKHLLLGSTANRVVRESTSPVLTVHPGDADELRDMQTILVPTDFSADAERAIEQVGRLFGHQAEQAQVVLAHVDHLPVLLQPVFAEWRWLGFEQDDLATHLHDRLQRAAQPLRDAGFDVECVLREGHPHAVISAMAACLRADLIAMGVRGRSKLERAFLGRTVERVIQHASCPVLTVRADAR